MLAMSIAKSVQDRVDEVENAAVYVSEAQEELRSRQEVLFGAIEEARSAGVSIRRLEVVSGINRETIRQIGLGLR